MAAEKQNERHTKDFEQRSKKVPISQSPSFLDPGFGFIVCSCVCPSIGGRGSRGFTRRSHSGKAHKAKINSYDHIVREVPARQISDASPMSDVSSAGPFDVRELQERIRDVLEREPACWGVLVHSTGLGRDIASIAPDTALVPASNVKLFTALASLVVAHVGPRFVWRTIAHLVNVGGSPNKTHGDDTPERKAMCVHPCGDPSFTSADLQSLLQRALAAEGVSPDDIDARHTQLGGDRWRDEGVPGTWEMQDLSHNRAAPPSRFVLDGNEGCLTGVTRSETDGAHSQPQSPADSFRDACVGAIKNAQTTGGAHVRSGEGDTKKERRQGLNPGVETTCGLVAPTNSREKGWAVHDSQPVSKFVEVALRDSDNLTSEQLLRTITGGKDSGRWLTSWSAVFCREKCVSTGGTTRGVDSDPSLKTSPAPRRIRFADASGLSRHNLAPPRAFVALVLSALEGASLEAEEAAAGVGNGKRHGFPDQRLERLGKPFTTFLESLPEISGRLENEENDSKFTDTRSEQTDDPSEDRDDQPEDGGNQSETKHASRVGTLGNRLCDLRGSIRAKTGTMAGTNALSGYFTKHASAELGTVVFSLIANNHASNVSDARFRLRDVVDDVIRLIDRCAVTEEES